MTTQETRRKLTLQMIKLEYIFPAGFRNSMKETDKEYLSLKAKRDNLI